MEDDPVRCPNCLQVSLLPVRAAEVPYPLMWACAYCTIVYLPGDLPEPEPEPAPEPSLLDRLKGFLHA